LISNKSPFAASSWSHTYLLTRKYVCSVRSDVQTGRHYALQYCWVRIFLMNIKIDPILLSLSYITILNTLMPEHIHKLCDFRLPSRSS